MHIIMLTINAHNQCTQSMLTINAHNQCMQSMYTINAHNQCSQSRHTIILTINDLDKEDRWIEKKKIS